MANKLAITVLGNVKPFFILCQNLPALRKEINWLKLQLASIDIKNEKTLVAKYFKTN